MKKICAIAVMLVIVLCLAGCNNTGYPPYVDDDDDDDDDDYYYVEDFDYRSSYDYGNHRNKMHIFSFLFD